ncbi:hypothetical protein llap_12533 [Limosa lapponica baueri]|uniref:Uncharacterized protein n=1 Tax=Limosa lapponica baueri TaxID=1758121 RepID=A0A2I0TTT9_LIMLA|nr:hypothetical protein llap_12533 [Limosa lapponica baueri]
MQPTRQSGEKVNICSGYPRALDKVLLSCSQLRLRPRQSEAARHYPAAVFADTEPGSSLTTDKQTLCSGMFIQGQVSQVPEAYLGGAQKTIRSYPAKHDYPTFQHVAQETEQGSGSIPHLSVKGAEKEEGE